MNGQFERDYRDALDGLRFSGEAKERMMKNLMEQQERKPEKRRGVRPLRAALIAAAACLALVGTAAAVTGAAGVTTRWVDGQPQFDREPAYVITDDGMALFPLSCFSEEVLTLAETRNEYGMASGDKWFNSWEEMEQFLGMDITDNPVLDAAGRGWSMGGPNTTHIWLATRGAGEDMTLVRASASYQLDSSIVNVYMRIQTEQYGANDSPWSGAPPEDEEERRTVEERYAAYEELYGGEIASFTISEGDELTEEEIYMAECGIPARIMRYCPRDSWMRYQAFFILDGTLFEVEVWPNTVGVPSDSSVDPEALLGTLKTVLDGFVLN